MAVSDQPESSMNRFKDKPGYFAITFFLWSLAYLIPFIILRCFFPAYYSQNEIILHVLYNALVWATTIIIVYFR